MSTMKRKQRERRSYTEEFKTGAVRLVLDEGKKASQVARDLDLTRSALDTWLRQAKVDRGHGAPGALTTEEREELSRLRKENRQLHMERELLKKAAAFFAKENA
jgi:transposase